MSQIKFEIFKIAITNSSNFSFEKAAKVKIDEFLRDANHVYINHTASIATEDIEEYGFNKTTNKYLIITLVYKDLNETEYDLSNVGRKTKKIVQKEIKDGETIPAPTIETSFDIQIAENLNKNKIEFIIDRNKLIVKPEDLKSEKDKNPTLMVIEETPEWVTVVFTDKLSDDEETFLKANNIPSKKKK